MGRKRLTTTDFVSKAITIHGDKYDYSKTVYTTAISNITIICNIHGMFSQRASNHLDGHGCKMCQAESRKDTLDMFILKSKKLYGNKYSYTKTKYINSCNKIIITCKKHGDFTQRSTDHLAGKEGCSKCNRQILSSLKLSSTAEFIQKSISIHKNIYSYYNTIYVDSRIPVSIYCKKHGEFKQIPTNHLSGKGCPKCKSPRGETEILKWYRHHNRPVVEQHSFSDCKYIKPLRFDFYDIISNTCIEFDGLQHFKVIKYFGGDSEFNKQIIRDNIKTEYCKTNNIKLLRIPYWDINNINKILTEALLN